jgi:hypothetical protein
MAGFLQVSLADIISYAYGPRHEQKEMVTYEPIL